jgi:hypothetical protein
MAAKSLPRGKPFADSTNHHSPSAAGLTHRSPAKPDDSPEKKENDRLLGGSPKTPTKAVSFFEDVDIEEKGSSKKERDFGGAKRGCY